MSKENSKGLVRLPSEIASVVADQYAQTTTNPGMALNHAVTLDKRLAKIGWDSPVTYCAHGVAGHGWNTDCSPDRAPISGLAAIGDTDSRNLCGVNSRGISQAYLSVRGAEIRALNLLYANQSLSVESLWLYFLNKYLAYFAPESNLNAYGLALAPYGATRFHRLRPKRVAGGESVTGPLISVLMPVFNAADTLEAAVGSILAQTWRNFELLLIDDCSQDASRRIAQELAQKDSRISVMSLRVNGGPYIAKNVGLSFARGDYVTVHDADDWAFPTRLADQIAPLLEDAKVKVSMGKTLRLDANGEFTRFQPPNWVTEDGAFRWCFPSPLFERRFLRERLGAWDSVIVGADTEIIQRVRRFAPEAVKILDIPVMLQLDSDGSLTRAEATHNDDRGESPMRTEYRQGWSQWHQMQLTLPKLDFPLKQRPFSAPSGMQKHALSCGDLVFE